MTCPSDVPRTVTACPTFSVLVARTGPTVRIGIGDWALAAVAVTVSAKRNRYAGRTGPWLRIRDERYVSLRYGDEWDSANEKRPAVSRGRRPEKPEHPIIEIVQDGTW